MPHSEGIRLLMHHNTRKVGNGDDLPSLNSDLGVTVSESSSSSDSLNRAISAAASVFFFPTLRETMMLCPDSAGIDSD